MIRFREISLRELGSDLRFSNIIDKRVNSNEFSNGERKTIIDNQF